MRGREEGSECVLKVGGWMKEQMVAQCNYVHKG